MRLDEAPRTLRGFFASAAETGNGITVEALPIDRTLEVLRRYNALGWDRTVAPRRGVKG